MEISSRSPTPISNPQSSPTPALESVEKPISAQRSQEAQQKQQQQGQRSVVAEAPSKHESARNTGARVDVYA